MRWITAYLLLAVGLRRSSFPAVNGSIPQLPVYGARNSALIQNLPFINKIRGGSTRAVSKEDAEEKEKSNLIEEGDKSNGQDSLLCDDLVGVAATSNVDSSDSALSVTKSDGRLEPLDKNKVSEIKCKIVSFKVPPRGTISQMHILHFYPKIPDS